MGWRWKNGGGGGLVSFFASSTRPAFGTRRRAIPNVARVNSLDVIFRPPIGYCSWSLSWACVKGPAQQSMEPLCIESGFTASLGKRSRETNFMTWLFLTEAIYVAGTFDPRGETEGWLEKNCHGALLLPIEAGYLYNDVFRFSKCMKES